jgi:hypothetical protein
MREIFLADNSDSEGLFITFGLTIIVVCGAGGMATETTPFEFFFILTGIIFSGVCLIIFIIFLTLLATRIWFVIRNPDKDTVEALKEQYSFMTIFNDTKIVLEHVKRMSLEYWAVYRERMRPWTEKLNFGIMRKLGLEKRGSPIDFDDLDMDDDDEML